MDTLSQLLLGWLWYQPFTVLNAPADKDLAAMWFW
jgi:hypothetical protein